MHDYDEEVDHYRTRMESVALIYGIDPITIITILMPILLELIKKCQERPTRMASWLTERDEMARFPLRRAIRRYTRQVRGSPRMARDLEESTWWHCELLGVKKLGQVFACMQQEGV